MSVRQGEVAIDPEAGDLSGAYIGPYRVGGLIGKGGMGLVYEATHQTLGQRAAVKVLSEKWAREPHSLRRFFNEARAISMVQHPGLVKIFDFGQLSGGTPYILMEYLAGVSLRTRLQQAAAKGQALYLADALRVARQAAGALAAAHELGIVHRDLKPENLFLSPDPETPGGERVKLLDFGVAKFTRTTDANNTSGSVLGTPTYMAPEQCVGDTLVDGKADVYSLGVLLYEMLSGVPPFDGGPEAVMRMHILTPPKPLRERVPTLPASVEELVQGMLAKQPEVRRSMTEIVAAIRQLELGETGAVERVGTATGPATPAPSTPLIAAAIRLSGRTVTQRRPIRWALAAMAVVALIASARQYREFRESRSHARATRMVMTGMALIPGGTFLMGSTPDEVEAVIAECNRVDPPCDPVLFEREQPAHQVTLSPFYLDQTEVTNDQFALWLNQQNWLDLKKDRYVYDHDVLLLDLLPPHSGLVHDGDFAARPGEGRRPVVQVTWDAAQRYCGSRGKRLPSEAEWEFAARGAERRRFPWGDAAPRCDGVAFGRDPGTFCPNLPGRAIDVGTSAQDRTPQGIFDLGGNVAEWVLDLFRVPYSECDPDCRDPQLTGPLAQDQAELRVVRGGTYLDSAVLCRSAGRSRRRRVVEEAQNLGFRCAAPLPRP